MNKPVYEIAIQSPVSQTLMVAEVLASIADSIRLLWALGVAHWEAVVWWSLR